MSIGKQVRRNYSNDRQTAFERYRRQSAENRQEATASVDQEIVERFDRMKPRTAERRTGDDDKWPPDISPRIRTLCELWWAMGCNRFNKPYLPVSREFLARRFAEKIEQDSDFWEIVSARGEKHGQVALVGAVQWFWKHLDDSATWSSNLVLKFMDDSWEECVYYGDLHATFAHLRNLEKDGKAVTISLEDNLNRMEVIRERRLAEAEVRLEQAREYLTALSEGGVVPESTDPPGRPGEGLKLNLEEKLIERRARQNHVE